MWIRDEDTFIGDYFEKTGDGFEIDHLAAALEFCEGSGFALDVGAHYGSWTRHLARRFERVVAFEPTPDTYACLERNVIGFPNVAIHPAAVGERSGRVSLGPGKMYSHPGMETINGDEGDVPLVRLDDLTFPKVDFLKIDVEGYELNVLKGAKQLLKRDRPVVILEENIRGPLEHGIDNGLCEAFLTDLGASLVVVLNKDFVFV